MDKDIIHTAIEKKGLQPGQTMHELESISASYPYFAAVHKLLSKEYKHANSHKYSGQVSHAALYTGNRAALHNWLQISTNDMLPVASPDSVSTTVPEMMVENISPPPNPESVPEIIAQETLPEKEETNAQAPPEALSQLASSILDEEAATAPLAPNIPIPDAESTPHVADRVQPIRLDSLERDILIEAIHSSIELEVSEADETATVEPLPGTEHREPTPAVEQIKDEATPAGSYAAWMLQRARKLHFGEESTESQKDIATPAPDHLQSVSTEEETEHADNSATAEPDTQTGHWPLRKTAGQRMQVKDNVEHQRELIDRFIRNDPKITRNKSMEYSTGNIARESLEEDLDLVTETMARLYAMQGKPEKARRAFKKLMELHPEKSIYFAAQLKNLDKFKKP